MTTTASAWGQAAKQQQAAHANGNGGSWTDTVTGSGGDDSGFDLDSEGVDSASLAQSRKVDKIGRYHFEIADAKERFETISDAGYEQRPNILVRCVVLQSVPGQSPAGSAYFHTIEIPTAADKEHAVGKGGERTMFEIVRDATFAFLSGIGLLKVIDGKIIDPETNSTKVNLKSVASRIKGMQFIGDIRHRDYEAKSGKNAGKTVDLYELTYGRGATQVDDPVNCDVPMNEDALAVVGKKRAAPAVAQDAPAAKGGKGKKGATAAAASAAPEAQSAPAVNNAPAASPGPAPVAQAAPQQPASQSQQTQQPLDVSDL